MTGVEALRALRDGKELVRIKRNDWGNEEWIQCDHEFKQIVTSREYDSKRGLLCVRDKGLDGVYGYIYSPVMMIEMCINDFLYDDWEVVE